LRNRADVKLNANPTWAIDANVGASSLDFDLSPYRVDDLRIDAGASVLKVRLGDRVMESRVRIHAGVSSIDIEVPGWVGCELQADTKLSSRRIRGFEKIGGDTYRTADFEGASKRIYIDLEAGVSRVRVSRYE
jgi:hypothetical protein